MKISKKSIRKERLKIISRQIAQIRDSLYRLEQQVERLKSSQEEGKL